MSWRVQWRAKTPSGNPAKIEFEDGHDAEGAAFKSWQLLASGRVCWVWVEDLDSPHKGNSLSKPKLRAPKTKR